MSTQNAQPENVAAFDPLRAYRAYMATTGATPLAYIKAMVTGKEWVRVEDPSE